LDRHLKELKETRTKSLFIEANTINNYSLLNNQQQQQQQQQHENKRILSSILLKPILNHSKLIRHHSSSSPSSSNQNQIIETTKTKLKETKDYLNTLKQNLNQIELTTADNIFKITNSNFF
jgi:hypothetical protein